jgi:sterol desaturase/sphingolipid hydroxylase (fatty acid hydroxylase superfamily)
MDSLREQWLILYSTPIYIIIIGLEIFLSHFQHKKSYSLKDTIENVCLMLLNGGLDLLFRVIYLSVLSWFYNHSYVGWHHAVAYWLLLLLAEDFIYYWLHRFDHEVRFFWATHVTHHSSEKINFTVGFRSSVFQPLYRFIYFIPLALCGFKPVDILFIYAATQIWGIFVHTEFINKMGWLEYIFVTPSHHRVHHARNPKYLDKNMGMFLIIWDKIFGTFQPELPEEEYEVLKYGLTKNIEKHTPTNIIFHEWIQLWKDIRQDDIGFKEKWNYIFGPPGWSHDGSRMTSEQLREEEQNIGYKNVTSENANAADLQIAMLYAGNKSEDNS